MPSIERTCKVTGKKFLVSELEQELREKFNASLPDLHPNERLRRLMVNRNVYTLVADECDLCGKKLLSMWGENPEFPVYCPQCWNSDNWKHAEMDVDFERPFVEQFKELINKSPHPSGAVVEPFVNSDYCNSVTSAKNCYMIFNATENEDSMFSVGINRCKNMVDVSMTNDGEYHYGSVSCDRSFQMFWSEFAINCADSYFLYDCVDCSNCALSTGLRHKQYVFMNEQLSKEEYEKKIADLKTGSYTKYQHYLSEFNKLKAAYPKKYLIGLNNEKVTGNVIFQSKNVVESYYAKGVEDSANVFNVYETKDALDMVAYGNNAEKIFSCTSVGGNVSNLSYSALSFNSCSDLMYSMSLRTSHYCFGSAFAKGLEYAILNKQYSKEEYDQITEKLSAKMKERGEWGETFMYKVNLHGYNESLAQILMPLKKEEAEKLGFRWTERKFPDIDPSKVYVQKDSINDVSWDELKDKVVVCEESGRPFRIIKQEFDFYKQYAIPLPRLHPEVRMFHRYPKELYFNLHDSKCRKCGTPFQTSMPDNDIVYCEKCYLENVG